MFDLSKNEGAKPRCLVTNTTLSNFLDHEQPPKKRRPFSTVLSRTFTHTLDLLLPESAAQILQSSLKNGTGTFHYARVHMIPLELISGDFFNTYIKSPTSEILMLSSGLSSSSDPTFTLQEGVLRLEVDKQTYERMGLQGKPIPTEGRKHVKARYAIELNLRLPSMVHGKPGFERITWAFKNVLNTAVTWLFCDVRAEADLESGPLAEHAPLVKTVEPEVTRIEKALVPKFPNDVHEEDYAETAELLEWLNLTSGLSPRIIEDDAVDPYLSRYQVPTAYGEYTPQNLVRFRWRGLIPASFALKIFLVAIKASGDQWVAINASAFDGEAYDILVHDGQALTWEYKD